MTKRSVPKVPNSTEIIRYSTVFALFVSLAVIIHEYHPVLKASVKYISFFFLTSAVIAILLALGIKDKTTRIARSLLLLTALWAFVVAFILPSSSPFIVINPFLVLIIAAYLNRSQLIMAVMILVLGVEASFIVADSHPTDRLIFIALHSLSMFLVGVLATWYSHSLGQAVARREFKEQQVNLEKERLASLINSMTDAVVAIDVDGKIAQYNGAALDLINSNISLDDHLIDEVMTLQDQKGNPESVVRLAKSQNGYVMSRDYQLVFGEEDKVKLYLNISPVRGPFGSADSDGYILLLRDITREKSLEEERDEFISVVSHELRTPIAIAEGNLSNSIFAAKQANAETSLVESLESSHKQVIFLSDMINDLATLSRAEQGTLKTEPEDIKLSDLIKNLEGDYTTEAKQKGLDLRVSVDASAKSLYSSRLYVREILQNFITNAIKYTEKGSIEVRAEQVGDKAIFKVTDTGIGITTSDQKLLFNKFFRSEDYRTRQNNGTGLGLYVTAKLARLLNAEIKVESELNKGSTFTIIIPSLPKNTHKHQTKE